MTSVISKQEKAGAMCSAVTRCDTSRMRRRYLRQRAREAAASNFMSAAYHVVGRHALELAEILLAPHDHLAEAFLPADLRLPADVALDRARVEPVARVLAEPIGRHLAELLEAHTERVGAEL